MPEEPTRPSASDADAGPSSDESPEPIDMLRPLFREEPLPPEGGEPPQLWVWMLIFGVLLFCTFYLGLYVGDFSPNPWLQSPEPTTQAGPPAEEAVSGAQVYSARCASCHQSNGQGVTNAFPTLIGTRWVENKGQSIRLVLHGLQGEIEVLGEIYNGNMPAWGSVLSDEEVAAVLTYVRQSWENDYPEVTAAEVAAVRAATDGRVEPWTAEELLQEENQTVPTEDTSSATSASLGRALYDQLAVQRPSFTR